MIGLIGPILVNILRDIIRASFKAQDNMIATVSWHDLAYFSNFQRKWGILERLLHISPREKAKVSTFLATWALWVLECNVSEQGGVVSDLLEEGLDVGYGLLPGSGHLLVPIGVKGPSRFLVFLEDVGTTHWHCSKKYLNFSSPDFKLKQHIKMWLILSHRIECLSTISDNLSWLLQSESSNSFFLFFADCLAAVVTGAIKLSSSLNKLFAFWGWGFCYCLGAGGAGLGWAFEVTNGASSSSNRALFFLAAGCGLLAGFEDGKSAPSSSSNKLGFLEGDEVGATFLGFAISAYPSSSSNNPFFFAWGFGASLT